MAIKNISNELVTIVMNTFGGWDSFTRASVQSIRIFYPDIRIITVEGHHGHNVMFPVEELGNTIYFPQGTFEDCLKLGAALVETPYFVEVNNNTKFQYPGRQIELMLEVMEDKMVAQTGAYAVKVLDWKARKALVGTDFRGSCKVDAFSGYLCMHRTKLFMQVGGPPKHLHFYDSVPKRFNTKLSSDLAIGTIYKNLGYLLKTPKEPIPHLHWDNVNPNHLESPHREWWYKNCDHKRGPFIPEGRRNEK